MKRPPDLWKHALAGVLLVLAAALWNVQYHRVQQFKAEERQRNGGWMGRNWRPVTPEERESVMRSIKGQLEAFLKDDYEAAVRYQSSELKANFPTVEMFRRMMKTSYPQFANYKSVDFGRARTDPTGEHVEIRVSLTGKDGVNVKSVYRMVKEGKVYRVQSVIGGAPLPLHPRRRERTIPSISV